MRRETEHKRQQISYLLRYADGWVVDRVLRITIRLINYRNGKK